MKTALFPGHAMRDYTRAIPLNAPRVWLSPERWGTDLVEADYLNDPEIIFPELHVKAGGPGAWGGYCQGIPFAPDKVRIVPYPVGHTTRNVLRIQGNYDGRGVGVCTRQFQPAVLWTPTLEVEWMTRFLFPSESQHPIYFNTELRGAPLFQVKKNESSELVGVHFMDHQLMAKWWHDGYDGIGTDEQHYEKLPYSPLRDVWYRITIHVKAGAEPNEWLTHIVVKAGGKTVWEIQTDASNSPNRFNALVMAMFGIERGGSAANPLETGTVYVAASCAWLLTSDETPKEGEQL